MNHVRADRWYKLGRTILYGRLEDEAPFQSVRRLVEYEDYALRLLRDAGHPHRGAVRHRRDHARARVPARHRVLRRRRRRSATPRSTTTSSTRGCRSIRQLWDAGLAHRDIKPANLLVRDGQLLAHRRGLRPGAPVAVAPGRRPRQHDAGPRGAHRRRAGLPAGAALLHADEIAEAFAAARGVASPTQLRAVMKQDGRDLLAAVPRAGARRGADLAAALERRAGRCSRVAIARRRRSLAVQAVFELFDPARDRDRRAAPTAAPAT